MEDAAALGVDRDAMVLVDDLAADPAP